jgi:hypothetical protein
MTATTFSKLLGVRDGKTETFPDFGLALRASEFAMGFILLAGGWRRFYNIPAKHDVESVRVRLETIDIKSIPCQSPCYQPDVGYEKPGFGA